MADVLKQTLYMSSVAADGVFWEDVAGTGAQLNRDITGAETHDSSDTTYLQILVSGDGAGISGDAYVERRWTAAHRTAASVTGPISFLRFIGRSRVTGNGSAGFFAGQIGANVGPPQTLSNSYVLRESDFYTDPATGLTWTNATINTREMGFTFEVMEDDAHYPTFADGRISEFYIEVWGPSATYLTGLSSASVTASSSMLTFSGSGVVVTVPNATIASGTSAVSIYPVARTTGTIVGATIYGLSSVDRFDFTNEKTAGGMITNSFRTASVVYPEGPYGPSFPTLDDITRIVPVSAGYSDGSDSTYVTRSVSCPAGQGRTGSFTWNFGSVYARVHGSLAPVTELSGDLGITAVRIGVRIRLGAELIDSPFSNWLWLVNPGYGNAYAFDSEAPYSTGLVAGQLTGPFYTVTTLIVPAEAPNGTWLYTDGEGFGVAETIASSVFSIDYDITNTNPYTVVAMAQVSEMWVEILGEATPRQEILLSQRFSPSNLVASIANSGG